jgi:NAD(P)H-dependent FMN reductase
MQEVTKIFITISGGEIQEFLSNSEELEVFIIDKDLEEVDEEVKEQNEEFEASKKEIEDADSAFVYPIEL